MILGVKKKRCLTTLMDPLLTPPTILFHWVPVPILSLPPSYEIVFRFDGDRSYDFKNIVTNQTKRDVSWWSIEISAVTYCNVNIYYNFMYKQLCLELNYAYRINECELLDSYNIRRTTLVFWGEHTHFVTWFRYVKFYKACVELGRIELEYNICVILL